MPIHLLTLLLSVAKALLYTHTLLSTASADPLDQMESRNARLRAQLQMTQCFRNITQSLMRLEKSGLVKYLPITL